MKRIVLLTAVILAFGFSSAAEARRAKRTGFNFGASLRVMNSDDQTFATDENSSDSHLKSTSQSVTPYLGYCISDAFDIGIAGLVENTTSERNDTNSSGVETLRTQSIDVKGISYFSRFMFANYFYFESGIGLYDQKVLIHQETKNGADDGSFTGNQADQEIHGIGPGYHIGAGLELPITAGFNMTAAYMVRAFDLRNFTNGEIREKRGIEQRREVSFGLSYYYTTSN